MLIAFVPPKHVKFKEKLDSTFNISEADNTIIGFSLPKMWNRDVNVERNIALVARGYVDYRKKMWTYCETLYRNIRNNCKNVVIVATYNRQTRTACPTDAFIFYIFYIINDVLALCGSVGYTIYYAGLQLS